MSVAELKTVLDWAEEEGWNPGHADAKAFHAADPGGFFLARNRNTPIAAISLVNHDPGHAFLGLYICRPKWRGRGVGLATWRHAIGHSQTRTIGLDGVEAQENNYRASGFHRTGSSLRHEGRWPACKSANIRAFAPSDLPVLIDLDATAGGFSRPKFLSSWLSPAGAIRGTRILLYQGTIVGFATWRACRTGTKVGPIIAPDAASALELVADIAELRSQGPLIVDLPEANTELRQELANAGFSVSFATARMYRGRPPVTDATLQAIATMELG